MSYTKAVTRSNSKECPKKQQCFSGATCAKSEDDEGGSVVLDETTSQFFCGSSWETLVSGCDSATPCPSGTNAGEHRYICVLFILFLCADSDRTAV